MNMSSSTDAVDLQVKAAIDRAWSGDVNGAHGDIKQYLSANPSDKTPLEGAFINALSAAVMMFAGKYEDGLAIALPALNVIEQNGLDEKVDWLYSAIAYTLGNLGDPERGLEWVGRALAVTEEHPHSPGRRKALSTQGTLLGLMNEYEPALASLRSALNVAEAQKIPRAIALCNVNIASTLIGWARILDVTDHAAKRTSLAEEALHASDSALAVDADHGPALTKVAARTYRGEALSLLGRHQEAREELTRLLPSVAGNEHRRAELMLALAATCMEDSDYRSARVYLHNVEVLSREQHFELLLLRILPAAVELEISAGDISAALDCSRRHAAFLEQHYRNRMRAATRSAELLAEAERLRRETESLRLQAKAWADAAQHDTLTGALNRRGLLRRAEQLMRSEQSLAVAAFDVDHFKTVNDNYGHAVGDAVLCQLTQLIATHSRTGDVLARIGGEEFILLLGQTDPGGAVRLCERIRAAIEQFDWASIAPGLAVTISIGLAGRLGESSLDALIARADASLYRAKHEGRNRVCVDWHANN